MASSTTRLGTILFRLRSFTPVPVIAALAVLLFRTRGEPGPGGAEVDRALDFFGIAVALTGQALRFYTLGLVQEGTSGQGSVLEAKALNTRGPYAHVRNPLYVGNLGIVLGLLLIAHQPWVHVIALGFFFGQYFFIIRAEEAFLEAQHGDAYREFKRRVRRWVPRLSPAYPGALNTRFDWHRALKKEHNPFTAWAAGAVLLLGWELHAREQLSAPVQTALGGVLVAILAAFAVIKAWKRRWLFA